MQYLDYSRLGFSHTKQLRPLRFVSACLFRGCDDGIAYALRCWSKTCPGHVAASMQVCLRALRAPQSGRRNVVVQVLY